MQLHILLREIKKKKEVEFKIENGNLVCNTGESFTVWLISNFSI